MNFMPTHLTTQIKDKFREKKIHLEKLNEDGQFANILSRGLVTGTKGGGGGICLVGDCQFPD